MTVHFLTKQESNMRIHPIPLLGAVLISTAVFVSGQETLQEPDVAPATTEEHTLPGGTKVSVENEANIFYQETGQNALDNPSRRVAIFVNNNAGEAFDEALPRILEQVTAQASGEDFEFVDYRDVVLAMQALRNAVKTADGVDQVTKVEDLQAGINAKHGQVTDKNLGGSGTTIDE